MLADLEPTPVLSKEASSAKLFKSYIDVCGIGSILDEVRNYLTTSNFAARILRSEGSRSNRFD